MDVDELTRELYALPPERFTAARDEAVKRLRADGRRQDAQLVRALRRPTVVAWAVNHLARARPELVDELLEAGAELAGAWLPPAAARRSRPRPRRPPSCCGPTGATLTPTCQGSPQRWRRPRPTRAPAPPSAVGRWRPSWPARAASA